jgi:hypothetical protein
MSVDSLMVYPLSQSTKSELKTLRKDTATQSGSDKFISIQENTCTEVKVGQFVGCIYGQKLWFGMVKDYDAEYENYIISFLNPSGIAPSYTFPNKDDSYPVPINNILGTVEAGLRGGTRIQYIFSSEDMENFENEHLKRIT